MRVDVGLMVIWGIAVTVYWMVVAWRAMRAHERIADALDRESIGRRGM